MEEDKYANFNYESYINGLFTALGTTDVNIFFENRFGGSKALSSEVERLKDEITNQAEFFKDSEFNKKMDEADNILISSLLNHMTVELTGEAMVEAMEDVARELKWTDTEMSPYKGNKVRAGHYGTFIEQAYFGLTDTQDAGSSPYSDFKKLMIESKSSLKLDTNFRISVGSITLSSVKELSQKEEESLIKLATLEKMFIKMRNLLYTEIEEQTNPIGRNMQIRIAAIDLYTTLIWKKLIQIVNDMVVTIGQPEYSQTIPWNARNLLESGKQPQFYSIIGTERTPGVRGRKDRDGRYSYGYKIEIGYPNLKRAEKLLEIYLHKYDLVPYLKGSDAFRRTFFAKIKAMDGENKMFSFPPDQRETNKDFK